jgi:hypothetical protein
MALTADAAQTDRGERSDHADRALRDLIDADHRARDASVRRRRYWLEHQAQETAAWELIELLRRLT